MHVEELHVSYIKGSVKMIFQNKVNIRDIFTTHVEKQIILIKVSYDSF